MNQKTNQSFHIFVEDETSDAFGRCRSIRVVSTFNAWLDGRHDKKPVEAMQKFRWIPPGEFMMGTAAHSTIEEFHCEKSIVILDGIETPVYSGLFAGDKRSCNSWGHLTDGQKKVVITEGFWIAETPCTQELWLAVMDVCPSHFSWLWNHPVEQVSWIDVNEMFLVKTNEKLKPLGLSLGLPTEEQWEYACRAGTSTNFNYGDNASLDYMRSGVGKFRMASTSPVYAYRPNPWGLFDMHGNVWSGAKTHDKKRTATSWPSQRVGDGQARLLSRSIGAHREQVVPLTFEREIKTWGSDW